MLPDEAGHGSKHLNNLFHRFNQVRGPCLPLNHRVAKDIHPPIKVCPSEQRTSSEKINGQGEHPVQSPEFGMVKSLESAGYDSSR